MTPEKAKAEVARIKQYRVDLRRVTFRHATLNEWRADLVSMRIAGSSYQDLVVWLKLEKKKTYVLSTVRRYLIQLPEIIEHNKKK